MQETQVRSLGWEDALEEETATHSSILAWRIPWTEEPGGLQSAGRNWAGTHSHGNEPNASLCSWSKNEARWTIAALLGKGLPGCQSRRSSLGSPLMESCHVPGLAKHFLRYWQTLKTLETQVWSYFTEQEARVECKRAHPSQLPRPPVILGSIAPFFISFIPSISIKIIECSCLLLDSQMMLNKYVLSEWMDLLKAPKLLVPMIEFELCSIQNQT